ncbi:MAG: hypothetical protein QXO69_03065 [archaeon]
MFKGQEFDTFKLMIAAVVAVAILGIMLSILGGITTPGQSFDDTAKQLIQKADQSKGATYPSAGEVSFRAGESYPSTIFNSASGGKPVSYVGSTMCSGTGSVCTITGSTLTINSNFRTTISVCCSTTGCKIGIGQTVTC